VPVLEPAPRRLKTLQEGREGRFFSWSEVLISRYIMRFSQHHKIESNNTYRKIKGIS
jgi:hypothetical protein